MRVLKRLGFAAATCMALAASSGLAYAKLGQPSDWEIGLQQAGSPIMQNIISFHHFLLVIITAISVFVLGLLVIVMVRFNAKANPVPSRTTHNTLLEVVWTVVPVMILVTIAVPSFRLLFAELDIPKPDLTVMATGHQWYWTYSYPGQKIEYNSLMVQDKNLKPGQPRLLTADTQLVVPVNKVIKVLTTGADVIHSFAVPSFGIKIDSIPGRMNDTWFKALKVGMYYGQCSELCGRDHSFMPINVKVVTEKEFQAWLAKAKKEYSMNTFTPRKTQYAAGDQMLRAKKLAAAEARRPTRLAAVSVR